MIGSVVALRLLPTPVLSLCLLPPLSSQVEVAGHLRRDAEQLDLLNLVEVNFISVMDGFEEGSSIRDAIGLKGSAQFGYESSGRLCRTYLSLWDPCMLQPVVFVEHFVSYRERSAGLYLALPFAFAQMKVVVCYGKVADG
ncbi:hypothetical protein Dimus_007912 [Dionaea muscipula]